MMIDVHLSSFLLPIECGGHRGGSKEHPNSVILSQSKKDNVYLWKLHFPPYKMWGFFQGIHYTDL